MQDFSAVGSDLQKEGVQHKSVFITSPKDFYFFLKKHAIWHNSTFAEQNY